MRSWIVIALLIATRFPASGNEDKTDENGSIKQKELVR
jgi:hypothetical protein